MRETFRAFVEHGVPFTIATDGPEMMRTHLRDELELLQRIGALDEAELPRRTRRGHEASFVHAQAPAYALRRAAQRHARNAALSPVKATKRVGAPWGTVVPQRVALNRLRVAHARVGLGKCLGK